MSDPISWTLWKEGTESNSASPETLRGGKQNYPCRPFHFKSEAGNYGSSDMCETEIWLCTVSERLTMIWTVTDSRVTPFFNPCI